MLFGYFEHNLDSKGRLCVPSKFRLELGESVYILKGFDGSLSIYKASVFEKVFEKLAKMNFDKDADRKYIRLTYSSANLVDIDKQGRLQIPATLLTKYHIGKDVAVIGVGDHAEIWDRKAYEEYEKTADEQFESIAENLDTNHQGE